jgi:nucleoside-diphosphate-sugar epimerase
MEAHRPVDTLVVGATGMVGHLVLERLGERALGLSRSPQHGRAWIEGDVSKPATLTLLPPIKFALVTAAIALLIPSIPLLATMGVKRIVVFSSTSVLTKANSLIAEEREAIANFVAAEQSFIAACNEHAVEWTILRPTLIYCEGKDANISRIAKLIRRFKFFPLSGIGAGKRQPVHADDLAIGAIAAANSPVAANKIYNLPGGETLSYREMVGRIFDAVKMPRRIIFVPPFLWRVTFKLLQPAFPRANFAMGDRMSKDMLFDPSAAELDFGWKPRKFQPDFSVKSL